MCLWANLLTCLVNTQKHFVIVPIEKKEGFETVDLEFETKVTIFFHNFVKIFLNHRRFFFWLFFAGSLKKIDAI